MNYFIHPDEVLWSTLLEIEGTYHSLDKVEVLGHHIIEVICDENSPDKQLREGKSKDLEIRFSESLFFKEIFSINKKTNLDKVVLLGAIFIKEATRSSTGHKKDGLEGDLPLSREVDVSQRILTVLLKLK